MSGFHSSIQRMLDAGRGNEWLKFERMRVYIRVGPRLLNPTKERTQTMCIQIANVSAYKPLTGEFTRMVASLERYGVPLYLENVMDHAWASALMERHGWDLVVDRGEFPSDLVRMPR